MTAAESTGVRLPRLSGDRESHRGVAQQLADLARTMQDDLDPADLLVRIVRAAVQDVEGARTAG